MSLKKVGVAILVFFTVILLGGGVYSKIEGWSIIDSIYFSTVTITTLGYGDFVPVTQFGKIFTIFFSVSGIALGLYIMTMLGKSLFTLELHRGGKLLTLIAGKKFNVEKMSIGTIVSWNTSQSHSEGIIVEVGLDYIKIHIEKRNGQLVPKKDQETIKISSKGQLKNK